MVQSSSSGAPDVTLNWSRTRFLREKHEKGYVDFVHGPGGFPVWLVGTIVIIILAVQTPIQVADGDPIVLVPVFTISGVVVFTAIIATILWRLDKIKTPAQIEILWFISLGCYALTVVASIHKRNSVFLCQEGHDQYQGTMFHSSEFRKKGKCPEGFVDANTGTSLYAMFIYAPRSIFCIPLGLGVIILQHFIYPSLVLNRQLYDSDAYQVVFSLMVLAVIHAREVKNRGQYIIHQQALDLLEVTHNRRLIVNGMLQSLFSPSILQRVLKGEVVADAGIASVLFSDVVSFTSWSSSRSAMQVVEMLNVMYRLFDTGLKTYAVEKITTIGDAYWASCGLPTPNDEHVIRICAFGRYLVSQIELMNTLPVSGFNLIKIRVGINTGYVTGGIIGKARTSYQLFGAVVQEAEALEQNAPTQGVLVSEATYTTCMRILGKRGSSSGILNEKRSGVEDGSDDQERSSSGGTTTIVKKDFQLCYFSAGPLVTEKATYLLEAMNWEPLGAQQLDTALQRLVAAIKRHLNNKEKTVTGTTLQPATSPTPLVIGQERHHEEDGRAVGNPLELHSLDDDRNSLLELFSRPESLANPEDLEALSVGTADLAGLEDMLSMEEGGGTHSHDDDDTGPTVITHDAAGDATEQPPAMQAMRPSTSIEHPSKREPTEKTIGGTFAPTAEIHHSTPPREPIGEEPPATTGGKQDDDTLQDSSAKTSSSVLPPALLGNSMLSTTNNSTETGLTTNEGGLTTSIPGNRSDTTKVSTKVDSVISSEDAKNFVKNGIKEGWATRNALEDAVEELRGKLGKAKSVITLKFVDEGLEKDFKRVSAVSYISNSFWWALIAGVWFFCLLVGVLNEAGDNYYQEWWVYVNLVIVTLAFTFGIPLLGLKLLSADNFSAGENGKSEKSPAGKISLRYQPVYFSIIVVGYLIWLITARFSKPSIFNIEINYLWLYFSFGLGTVGCLRYGGYIGTAIINGVSFIVTSLLVQFFRPSNPIDAFDILIITFSGTAASILSLRLQEVQVRASVLDRNVAKIAIERAGVELSRGRDLLSQTLPAFVLPSVTQWIVAPSEAREPVAGSHPEVGVLFCQTGLSVLPEHDGGASTHILRQIYTVNALYDSVLRGFEEEYDEIDERRSGVENPAANYFPLVKIKTIGDCMLVVTGLIGSKLHSANFQSNSDSAKGVVGSLARLALFAATLQENLEGEKKNRSAPLLNLTAGLHVGPLVGGVLGTDRLIYDVFGDTVNTASRVMTSGSSTDLKTGGQGHGIFLSGTFLTALLESEATKEESKSKIEVKIDSTTVFTLETGEAKLLEAKGKANITASKLFSVKRD